MWTLGASYDDFCLARYSTAGVLDAGFGTGGKVISPIGPGRDMGQAVAVQADGKIVVAGLCFSPPGSTAFCLARYEGGRIGR